MSVFMKLLVVISLMLTLNHVVVHSELYGKAQLTLTNGEISEIVNTHNELRASKGASDMEMMTWNESLARAALDWGWFCDTNKDKLPLPNTSFTEYGQHYYVMNDYNPDAYQIIKRWIDEKDSYTYDTLGCNRNRKCEYYSQAVWATSREIGCARFLCQKLSPGYYDVEILICNYLPAGNEQGQKPYKKGPPCSQCGNGAGWCKDGLCNSQCSKKGKDCSCKAVCHNCATFNCITCQCSCTDGWHGPDCSERCEDKKGHCTGLLPDSCNHGKNSSRIKRECPVMCKLCKPNPNAKAGNCPPVSAQAKLDKSNGTSSDDNGSQHQQQRITLTLLSNVILSLTITWKALL